MHHETHPRWSARERMVCPCGCIFQAAGDADECWTCGRLAGAIKAEQERIVASIRGLPEVEPLN